MNILFVRHAEAEDREGFQGEDLDRPLTRRGVQRFRAALKNLAPRIDAPEAIVSSLAVRAVQTADLVARAFGVDEVLTSADLNPGASPAAIRRVIGQFRDVGTLAVVGHEPDLSSAISALCAGGRLSLDLKKGAIACVEFAGGSGALAWIVTPRVLGGRR